ncbi:phospholipase D family protein [Asticcacaulis biprosthecium]|nr:phospholipase D family protein [Asticcacaulis biprosthecium]
MHDLILQPGNDKLKKYYRRAFENCTELVVVSAYLTEWDSKLKLSEKCKYFKIIVGKDFGITRKSACEAVLSWLPSNRKSDFLVVEHAGGFHPKAVFWREVGGDCFCIVGSSNLTVAAFDANFEVNGFSPLSNTDYEAAKKWVEQIKQKSVVVCEDWLARYKEAPRNPSGRGGRGTREQKPTISLKLPKPAQTAAKVQLRRKKLKAFSKQKSGLLELFNNCATGIISSSDFYDTLPMFWSYEKDNRLQGEGWNIKGKASDFGLLSKCFLSVKNATPSHQDDAVRVAIDTLQKAKVPSRKAFLSEMLCLFWPEKYPLLNAPVMQYLRAIKFRPPKKASEGAAYIALAVTLRRSLLENPNHPAKNLAELDQAIWLKYGKK